MHTDRLSEERERLWILAASPTIWAAHFLLSYVTAAIWCAKVVGRDGSLAAVQAAVAVYTLLALMGIGLTFWRGYRRHRMGTATAPHDLDTPADRHRFIGFATVLLSGLSAVATLYVAIVAVFVNTCV